MFLLKLNKWLKELQQRVLRMSIAIIKSRQAVVTDTIDSTVQEERTVVAALNAKKDREIEAAVKKHSVAVHAVNSRTTKKLEVLQVRRVNTSSVISALKEL